MGNNGGDVREVSISDIVRDEKVQPRFKMDPATVRKYAKAYKAGVDMPPIQLAQVGNVKILVDGWHRVAALESNGEHRVQALVTKAKRKELPWLAALANSKHGKPLKRGEIKEMFHPYMQAEKYLGEDGKPKSYRDIATELGGTYGYTTVRKWMLASYRRIANQYYSREVEEHISGGGDRPVEPEADFQDMAHEALNKALTLFRGVDNAYKRGELISRVEEMLLEMKGSGEWLPYEGPQF
ncbi:MAG: hypothetical protein ACLQBD_13625 [Syntrophobacteraceae bacterium]